MTDRYDTTQISRRKVLAGLGVVGVSAAGAGLGTSAFFSDREDFRGNSLVAGSLDMKVDWEEHYSDWSEDESQFARMPRGDEEADYILPALSAGGVLGADAKEIELVFNGTTAQEKQDAKDNLWDVTSIEAFPDADDDGIQDSFDESEACNILADVGGAGTGLSSDARTDGTVNGQTTESGDPLINFQDVKPGDFGEVTLSFHLCDNPGYVWLNGSLVSADENGLTEPEASDPDEQNGVVELLDEIVTRVWYDPNGNNQVDQIAGELDIMLALDASGSIDGSVGSTGSEADNLFQGVQEFVGALPSDGSTRVGQVVFGENDDITRFQSLTDTSTYSVDYPIDPAGNTPIPPALDIAGQELDSNGRAGAQKVVVLFTDGAPNYDDSTFSAGGYTAPRANDYSLDSSDGSYNGADSGESETEQEETSIVADLVRQDVRIATVNVGDPPDRSPSGASQSDSDAYPKDLDVFLEQDVATTNFAFVVDIDDLTTVAADLVSLVVVSEEVFFQGTLREALAALNDNDGRGIPLDGDRSTQFDELGFLSAEGDQENNPARDCFDGAGTTHYLGFQWWVPINHANQIQTDSVSFDLGFYTEQCRHNDGSGMVPEETAETTPTPN